MIDSGNYTDRDAPPQHPAFDGTQPKRSKKPPLSEAIVVYFVVCFMLYCIVLFVTLHHLTSCISVVCIFCRLNTVN